MGNLFKVNKHYVSEFEKFLKEKRQNFPLTPFQEKEIMKSNIISDLRDNVREKDNNEAWWEDF